jgi:hypothetical protein
MDPIKDEFLKSRLKTNQNLMDADRPRNCAEGLTTFNQMSRC